MRHAGRAAMALRPALLTGLLALGAGTPALGQQDGHASGMANYAEPSDIITADLGFSRMAQGKGLLAASRVTAATDAEVLVRAGASTTVMRVEAYAKGQDDVRPGPNWDPYGVWMSCDGSIAVTRGVWREAEGAGWYVTVWQHQPKGGFKWVLRLSDTLTDPPPAPEMINASQAECPARRSHAAGDGAAADAKTDTQTAKAGSPDFLLGESKDHTLAWTGSVSATGAPGFALRLKHEGQLREVLHLP